MYYLLGFFTLLFGLSIGSFLTVVIYRLPRGESIVWGRSKCPKCQHTLGWRSLIPVVSYLSLGGKCASCKTPISAIYPIIELTTGALFLLAYMLVFSPTLPITGFAILHFGYLIVLFSLLVALFYIDLFDLLLLDVLVFPALAVTLLFHGATAIFFPESLGPMPNILYGYVFGLGVTLFFLALIIATRGKGMGGGDVKYALVLGAVAGWPNAIVALFTAFVTGAVVGVALIALRRKSMKEVIPFGPFLIAGTIIALVYGTQIVDFYMNFILG